MGREGVSDSATVGFLKGSLVWLSTIVFAVLF